MASADRASGRPRSHMRHLRYILFLTILAGVSVVAAQWLHPLIAYIAGFDIGALVFIASTVPLWRERQVGRLRDDARREDGGHVMLLTINALIVLTMLIAVTTLLADKNQASTPLLVALIITPLIGWAFINTVYSIHYARLYYDSDENGQDREGLDFPHDDKPDFSDFCNFAFVIGMTCQTADIAICSSRIRRVTTIHGMLSFVFNLGVLALMVNVVASLL